MSKLQKIRTKLKELELDALLVYSPYNLRYISNFTGTTGYALISQEQAFFITDARYTEQATVQAEAFDVIEHHTGWMQALAKIVEQHGYQSIGFEEQYVTVCDLKALQQHVKATFVHTISLVEELREVKDEQELQIIRQACLISDAAFSHILNFIKPGISEIEVANELDFYMRSKGATGVSFDTIVASGVRSALPHGVATHKIIEYGDIVTLDFGCYFEGYVSDMTRTIAVGALDDRLKEMYAVVQQAQALVNQAAGPGKTGAELDSIARKYITQQGYGEYFVHSTGHGIGVEVHEAPNVSRLGVKPFVAGNVITNEPGVYIAGLGGVRIEDDLIITETGVEILQTVTKELIIL